MVLQKVKPKSSNTPSEGFRWYVVVLLLFAAIAAFGARTWNAYDYVFDNGDNIRLLGVDSLFHIRHAKYTLENYPKILRKDTGASYPDARQNDASGLFGVAISSLTLLAYGEKASINELAKVSVWLTPALSTITCLFLFLLVRLLSNNSIGIIAVCFFVLYPGKSLDRSILGFIDHHAAEYCLSLAISLGIAVLFRRIRQGKHQISWKRSIFSALPLVLLIYTWQGAPLVLFLVNIVFFIYWCFALAKGYALKPIAYASFQYGILILCSSFFVAGSSTLLVIGSIALAIGGLCFWQLQTISVIASWKRFASAFLVISAALTLILIFQCTGMGKFFYNLVFEQSKNYIFEEAVASVQTFFYLFGIVGALAILSALITPVMIWKDQLPDEAIVPTVFGVTWFCIWWMSGDFDYLVPCYVAVFAALFVYMFSCYIRRETRLVFFFSCGILLIAPIYPLKVVSLPWVEQSKLVGMTIYSNAWYESAAWLKNNTPEPARTPLTDSSNEDPENKKHDYGVIAAWDFGNVIASHGNRIPVWSGLPSSYIPKWLLAQDEQMSLSVLAERTTSDKEIRYAIVDSQTYGPLIHAKSKFIDTPIQAIKHGQVNVDGKIVPLVKLDQTHSSSIITKLYAEDGVELSHYRLVYESADKTYNAGFVQLNSGLQFNQFNYAPKSLAIKNDREYERYQSWTKASVVTIDHGYLLDGQIHSTIKVFEIVKGITVKGQAQPKDIIQARLELESKTTGRRFVYQRTAQADAEGDFELVVPYPTDRNVKYSDIVALGDYELWVKSKGASQFVLRANIHAPETTFEERKLNLDSYN